MKKFNKVLLKSKAKSYIVFYKNSIGRNNYLGVMQLYISYHKRGIKKRKFNYYKKFDYDSTGNN